MEVKVALALSFMTSCPFPLRCTHRKLPSCPPCASPDAALDGLWLSYSHTCTHTAPLCFSPVSSPCCCLLCVSLSWVSFVRSSFGQPLLVLLFILEEVILEKLTGSPGPLSNAMCHRSLPSRSLNKARLLS